MKSSGRAVDPKDPMAVVKKMIDETCFLVLLHAGAPRDTANSAVGIRNLVIRYSLRFFSAPSAPSPSTGISDYDC